jgi:nucleotide-binding universal stress UspA family protein
MIRYCENALGFGILMANNYGSGLYVLHLMEDPFRRAQAWNLSVPAIIPEEAYRKKVDEIRNDLDAIINAYNVNGIKVIKLIRKGASDVIMRVAKENNIDLIIMSAHEESRVEHFLFRSANEKIIRKLPCSLVLVKKEPAVFGATY